jgi:hypothetical protein
MRCRQQINPSARHRSLWLGVLQHAGAGSVLSLVQATGWGVRLQAVGEGGVAAAGALGADGGGQGSAGSGQHDQLLGPGDPV